jgi:hypothetical protein
MTLELHTHITACSHAASRCTIYSLLSTHTNTHIHTERGESSKLRRDFVPLMNLQRDSIESPFTYMYVINTTYYYCYKIGMLKIIVYMLACSLTGRTVLNPPQKIPSKKQVASGRKVPEIKFHECRNGKVSFLIYCFSPLLYEHSGRELPVPTAACTASRDVLIEDPGAPTYV